MPQYLHQTFHKTDEDLKSQSFDTNLSGSTCSVLIFDRNTLFSANAGDSRAVLYSARSIKALTEDHKPCLPVERRRVIEHGGRVDTIKGSKRQSLGPSRVWMHGQNTPGLAMSRSLGDRLAHTLGVSTDPEIKRFELTP